jgi:hypothetical protein
MAFVFLDHICFWRRYYHNLLRGPDVLADLIKMDVCRGIIFSKIFTDIFNSDRRRCFKMAILDGFKPHVCYGAETAPMLICYGVLYGFLFINIVRSVFLPTI